MTHHALLLLRPDIPFRLACALGLALLAVGLRAWVRFGASKDRDGCLWLLMLPGFVVGAFACLVLLVGLFLGFAPWRTGTH